MESLDPIFHGLAILHGFAGYVLFGAAANEEIQESCFYGNRNPLAGDIRKYLAYFACWSLIACAVLAFIAPRLAVGAAWLSILLYLLTGMVDPVFEARWPALCKSCAISFGVRAILAIALGMSLQHGQYG